MMEKVDSTFSACFLLWSKAGETMPEETKISKAQQKAVHKYVKNNYDRLELTVPKGRKAEIKAHAEAQNESVNAFIVRAVNETIERDNSSITE